MNIKFAIVDVPFGDYTDPSNILSLGNVAYIQNQLGETVLFEVAIAGHTNQRERGNVRSYNVRTPW